MLPFKVGVGGSVMTRTCIQICDGFWTIQEHLIFKKVMVAGLPYSKIYFFKTLIELKVICFWNWLELFWIQEEGMQKSGIFTKIIFFAVLFFKVSAWLSNRAVCKIGLRSIFCNLRSCLVFLWSAFCNELFLLFTFNEMHSLEKSTLFSLQSFNFIFHPTCFFGIFRFLDVHIFCDPPPSRYLSSWYILYI